MTTPNPHPSPNPPRPKRLLLWLGCAVSLFFVILLAIGIAMFWMVRRPTETGRMTQRSPLPAEWRDRLREEKEAPDVARRLAPARTDTGNAAPVLYFAPGRGRNATVVRLARGLPVGADDTAAIAGAARDTLLDRALRAARMRRYSVVPLMVADTLHYERIFWVRVPSVFVRPGTGAVLDGLILRGYDRMRRGRAAAGEQDLRAAIGLGLMMYEREPTMGGANRGLRAVEHGATLLARAAAQRRQPALAAAAESASSWAGRRVAAHMTAIRGLYAVPDSALAVVVDTTLPFAVRADALYLGSLATMRVNPWRAFKGPSDAVWRRAKAYEEHSDPDFAALGLALDSALTRIERVGRFRRTRLFLRGL